MQGKMKMPQNPVYTAPAATPAVHDEHILVVKRDELFTQYPAWNGLNKEHTDYFIKLVEQKKEFIPRSVAEEDATYKQIIPYLIFRYGERYFLMQRQSQASESRLQSKYSLGIGGHIRQEDIQQSSIFSWAQREFHEEVKYTDAMSFRPVGVLNDDTNSVGQVHLGIVMLIQGQTPNIQVKSELKSGKLYGVRELELYQDRMESWSQILLAHLLKSPRLR
jgi:predicted NUDIX family phosphoesterase